jgi:LemA protein
MKKSVLIVLAAVAGIAIIFGGTCVSSYNRLVNAEEDVDGAWSQVENVLQRRADLIPNLVESVKGYAAHEREVFTEVANARSRLLAARTPGEAEAADAQLQSALGRLLAIAEAYPQLKADQSFLRLQDELAGTENRIAVERKRYNDTVRDFNARIRRFPASLVASVSGFDRKDYFETQPGARDVPKVDFRR